MNRSRYLVSALASACLLALSACSGVTDSPAPSDAPQPSERALFDPTAQRAPKQSKSLTLAPNWQPPPPTRTSAARAPLRLESAKNYGVPNRTVSPHPSDAEIRAVPRFPEPLRPVPGASLPAETNALGSALRDEPHDDRGIDALERFVEAYPRSRWAPAIHLNIASISYRTGYFQDALTHGWRSDPDA